MSTATPQRETFLPGMHPEQLAQILHLSMQQGLAVTVVPQTMVLTTQQAADLLGVSRPTLIT